jgi:dCTP deaminase
MTAPSTAARAGSPTDREREGAGGGILVDRELAQLVGGVIAVDRDGLAPRPAQVQPASYDLRLGRRAIALRCGFLPERSSIEQRLRELAIVEHDLDGEGEVLQPGQIYLVPLEERLELAADQVARFNPRSSSGRCDVFCRVLVPGHPRYDETPAGYRGELWLEVVPLSFPVRLRRGDRLVQLRIQRGDPGLSADELRAIHRETPLAFDGERPLSDEELRVTEDGSLELRVGLSGRKPCGWRAALHTAAVDFAGEGVHERFDFWESVYPRGEGDACILDPGRFYIFASRERLRVPPDLAAEMLAVDLGLGEVRNNYAGFFDPGFGWETDASGRATESGTPAVLEVRAHDVPFLLEDGQLFFRLRYFRTTAPPERLYGEGREASSYRRQDLTLARPFRS